MIHEMVHSKQWWEHGILFPFRYWRAGQEAGKRYWGPDPPSYYWNPYEIEAFKAMYEYLEKYGDKERRDIYFRI
jgi:hypothetical protein